MQLLAAAGARAVKAAIGGCDVHETVGPPASAVISLSTLM
jgi:hypothetical protein